MTKEVSRKFHSFCDVLLQSGQNTYFTNCTLDCVVVWDTITCLAVRTSGLDKKNVLLTTCLKENMIVTEQVYDVRASFFLCRVWMTGLKMLFSFTFCFAGLTIIRAKVNEMTDHITFCILWKH